jgi:hypothetical protein
MLGGAIVSRSPERVDAPRSIHSGQAVVAAQLPGLAQKNTAFPTSAAAVTSTAPYVVAGARFWPLR